MATQSTAAVKITSSETPGDRGALISVFSGAVLNGQRPLTGRAADQQQGQPILEQLPLV